jgi:hypothetical protein
MAIALTDSTSVLSLDHVNAGTKERARIRGLAAFLLLFTFALALHIQSAKYEHPFVFPAHHILHGDLRPDAGKIQAAISAIGTWCAPPLALLPALFSAAPLRFFREAELSFENSHLTLVRYLARLFRAPPLFRHCVI